MKALIKPTKVEWLSFSIMMPFICLLLNNLLFGVRAFTDVEVWLYSFPPDLFVWLCILVCSDIVHELAADKNAPFGANRPAAYHFGDLSFHDSIGCLCPYILFL